MGQNVVGGLNALRSWVASTNATGGLAGHQVRLEVADDGTDPARHRALVQEFVERRGVVAFVYNAAVFSGQASVEYLNARKIPVVGGSGTEPWYTTSPMFFTQIIAGEVAIEATTASYARSAKAANLTKMGLVTCSDGVQVCEDTSRSVPKYASKYGVQLAYQGKASLAAPDFTANCLAARNAGVQILYLALDGNSYQRFGRSCASVDYHPRYGIAQPVMLTELARDSNMQGSPGVSYTAPFFFDANAAVAEFHRAMSTYAAGVPLTGSASLGWSAAKLLQASAKRLSAVPTSADILEGVWSLNGEDLGGLTAPLRFRRRRPDRPARLLLAGRRRRQQLQESRQRPAALRAMRGLGRRERGRRARRAGGALALFGVATLLSPSPPTAATGGSPERTAFRGVAAAEGIRVGVSAVGAPVTNNVVDGASPIAQAAVDSTSGSSALASVAYPGDVVVTTPGLLAGVSGGQLSGVPPYPLIATAGSTTTPEQKVDGPGSTMRAAATARRAEATARSGAPPATEGGPAPAWVTSSFVEADDIGVVTSLALSDVTGVTIGPLTLGRVTARSVVRRAPGADPTRETTFEATGITVGDAAVALTPAGLVLAGTTTPVSASPLQPVLDGAGISVRSLTAEDAPDGVVSAGLVITQTQALPTAISPVTVSYTFGRALAAVSPTALAPVGSVDPADPYPSGPITEPDSSPAPSNGDSSDAFAADGPGGEAGGVGTEASVVSGSGSVGGTASVPGAGSTVGAGADTAGGAAGASDATGEASVPIRRVETRLFDLSAIYLLLVAAAATAGAVIQFVRRPGVR